MISESRIREIRGILDAARCVCPTCEAFAKRHRQSNNPVELRLLVWELLQEVEAIYAALAISKGPSKYPWMLSLLAERSGNNFRELAADTVIWPRRMSP